SSFTSSSTSGSSLDFPPYPHPLRTHARPSFHSASAAPHLAAWASAAVAAAGAAAAHAVPPALRRAAALPVDPWAPARACVAVPFARGWGGGVREAAERIRSAASVAPYLALPWCVRRSAASAATAGAPPCAPLP